MSHFSTTWDAVLLTNFSDAPWEKALAAINISSSCSKLSVIQFEVLFRQQTLWIFSRLNCRYLRQMLPKPLQPDSQPDMYWPYSKLTNYWQGFFKSISDILGISGDPSAPIAIFCVRPDKLPPTSRQGNVMVFTSLVAGGKMFCLWQSSKLPSFKSWLHNLLFLLKQEKTKC